MHLLLLLLLLLPRDSSFHALNLMCKPVAALAWLIRRLLVMSIQHEVAADSEDSPLMVLTSLDESIMAAKSLLSEQELVPILLILLAW